MLVLLYYELFDWDDGFGCEWLCALLKATPLPQPKPQYLIVHFDKQKVVNLAHQKKLLEQETQAYFQECVRGNDILIIYI